jgi:signal transduction histidine kinase
VLDNLLANALKFSPPGTRVTVTGAREEDEVVVEVTDQGPGIALDEQELVFDRFYRGSPSHGTRGGTGLGLSIAHRFVEALGGRIWVESEPGAGATFVFALPAASRRGDQDAGVEVHATDHAITT